MRINLWFSVPKFTLLKHQSVFTSKEKEKPTKLGSLAPNYTAPYLALSMFLSSGSDRRKPNKICLIFMTLVTGEFLWH
jgi:hypothetical protein